MPRLLVLAGGLTPERDVSLRSGRRVAEAVRARGVEVEVRDLDATLLDALSAAHDAGDVVVVPLLHGASGEDGALRDVLETLRLPYVGSRPGPSRLAFDKAAAAAVLARHGVNVPDALALPHSTFRELGAARLIDAIVARLGLPLVVKPVRGGSALGVAVVRDVMDLPGALVGAYAYDDTALLERCVTGVEVAVSVVDVGPGPRALPVVEIVADGGVYDYSARYTAGSTEFFVPARLDEGLARAVADVALTAHRELGLRHWSRTDAIIDTTGDIWFLEVNVAPGTTETSTLPQAAEAGGLDLGTLVIDLAAGAMADHLVLSAG